MMVLLLWCHHLEEILAVSYEEVGSDQTSPHCRLEALRDRDLVAEIPAPKGRNLLPFLRILQPKTFTTIRKPSSHCYQSKACPQPLPSPPFPEHQTKELKVREVGDRGGGDK